MKLVTLEVKLRCPQNHVAFNLVPYVPYLQNKRWTRG